MTKAVNEQLAGEYLARNQDLDRAAGLSIDVENFELPSEDAAASLLERQAQQLVGLSQQLATLYGTEEDDATQAFQHFDNTRDATTDDLQH